MNTTTYIYPPRPEGAVPRGDYQIFEDLGWIAQYKYNDTRCLVKFCSDGRIQLWNRHAEMMRSYHPPIQMEEQLQQLREQLGPGYHLLDGGLLDQKHKAIKDALVLWDILVLDGQQQLGTTYASRYQHLQSFTTDIPWIHGQYGSDFNLGNQISDDIFTPTNWTAKQWPTCWETIDEINQPWLGIAGPVIEGLLFKDLNGELEHGFKPNNNAAWQARSRVKTNRHMF